ncbi:MAG: FMN-binding protein, partial [Sphaerochaetaceae bacterium]|nr:FMN-binding protein [Sphaerochaetaceae bacterium]
VVEKKESERVLSEEIEVAVPSVEIVHKEESTVLIEEKTPLETEVQEAIINEIVSTQEEDTSGFKDGVYSGTGTGYRGSINVEVEVEGGKITSISIVSSREDRQFLNRAKDTVINNIIKTQSNEVSAISGATFSSNGIIEAVSDALGLPYTKPTSSRKYH